MKVLSVRQPFAAFLVCGKKRLEARTWSTTYRGPLLIHASAAPVSSAFIESVEAERELFDTVAELGWTTHDALKGLPRSAIVGQVDLMSITPSEDCDDATDRDYLLAAEEDPSIVFWRVANPLAFDPLPIDGRLNVWELPSDVAPAVEDARRRASSAAPAWVSPKKEGRPLRLVEYTPSPDLERVIGAKARTRREIFFATIAYARAKNLRTPKTIRLDAAMAFLKPGKTTIHMADLTESLDQHIQRVP